MRAAERSILLEVSAEAVMFGERRFHAVGRRFADEHHVIARGEQRAVRIERQMNVTQAVSRF